MALTPHPDDPNRKSELERKRREPESFNERRDSTKGSSKSAPSSK